MNNSHLFIVLMVMVSIVMHTLSDFVHDSKMKIYANLNEMMINGGVNYLF